MNRLSVREGFLESGGDIGWDAGIAIAGQDTTTGAEARPILRALRGAEAPLFHGAAQDMFRYKINFKGKRTRVSAPHDHRWASVG
jgi:hypothetical protein